MAWLDFAAQELEGLTQNVSRIVLIAKIATKNVSKAKRLAQNAVIKVLVLLSFFLRNKSVKLSNETFFLCFKKKLWKRVVDVPS